MGKLLNACETTFILDQMELHALQANGSRKWFSIVPLFVCIVQSIQFDGHSAQKNTRIRTNKRWIIFQNYQIISEAILRRTNSIRVVRRSFPLWLFESRIKLRICQIVIALNDLQCALTDVLSGIDGTIRARNRFTKSFNQIHCFFKAFHAGICLDDYARD